jgi:diacylglycerol kinase family enzyme
VKTKSAETLRNFAKNTILAGANAGKSQTVLMLSGDGGIVDTINGLLEGKNRSRYGPLSIPPSFKSQYRRRYTKPALVQIPLGTGNALFHSLHRQSSLISFHLQGLRSLLFGSPKPLPIFKATFSPGAQLLSNEGQTATLLNNNVLYGAVVVSYGLHSTLVADSDTTEYRKHGDRRFGLVANDLLFPKDGSSPHAYYASISLDEKPIEEKFHGYVLASLVSNLEKTFTISPNSEPLDGKLRVVRFGPIDGTLAMEVMKNAYEGGKHVNMDVVEYSTVEKIRVVFHEASDNWMWRRCCIDGLIIAVEKDGWMEVEMVENGEEAVMIVVDAD